MRRTSYAKAGVDLAKVGGIHRLLEERLELTYRNRRNRLGAPILGIGHYAGIIDIGGGRALTLHTDGVGTKLLVAQLLRRFDTVGIDCVAMTVNDLICVGSEPVALLDYIALERENDSLVAELVKGLTVGARAASAAIVGGETAILKGVIKGIDGNGFDLASMGVGIVEKDAIIDGKEIARGDRVVGIASTGLHSNGFTLARKVLLRRHALADAIPELGRTMGEELLIPTRIYVRPVLDSMKACETHGLAHITGGAYSKLKRILKTRNLSFSLDRPPSLPVFDMIQGEGAITRREMYRTFNMGVGFCIVAPPSEVDAIVKICSRGGDRAFEFGTVKEGEGVSVGGVRVA